MLGCGERGGEGKSNVSSSRQNGLVGIEYLIHIVQRERGARKEEKEKREINGESTVCFRLRTLPSGRVSPLTVRGDQIARGVWSSSSRGDSGMMRSMTMSNDFGCIREIECVSVPPL